MPLSTDQSEQLFPFDCDQTFTAVLQAMREVKCQDLFEDKILKRIVAKTPGTLFGSWSKSITVRFEPTSSNQTRVIFEIEFPSVVIKMGESRHQRKHVQNILMAASQVLKSRS